MKAMLPATAGAIAVHPLFGTALTIGRTPLLNFNGPNDALPTWVFEAGRTGGPLWVATEIAALPTFVKRYMRMRGRAPSAGVDMLALLRPLKSWAWALTLSPSTPPRP